MLRCHISGSSAVGSAIYYDENALTNRFIENIILQILKNPMITAH